MGVDPPAAEPARGEVARQLAQRRLGGEDGHVEGVAEDRRLEHAGRLLERGERLAERLALDEQQPAAHRWSA